MKEDPGFVAHDYSLLKKAMACVTGGWGEEAPKRKITKAQNNFQTARQVPATRCTLCWAAF